MMIEYGSFFLDEKRMAWKGPSKYMEERFEEFFDELENKTNLAYKSVVCAAQINNDEELLSNINLMILHALQLDYSQWHGIETLIGDLK